MKWLLVVLLFFSSLAQANNCIDIWTQAVRSNSAVPASIPFPATANPNLPQPLQPVDYYYAISDNHSIANGTIRTTTGTTTRLFYNGNLTIGNNAELNSGGPAENFILVVSGNLVLNNNAVINGFVLVGGSVQLNNNSVINGALTAKGAVANFGTVSYLPDAIPALNGGVVCDAFLPPAVLRAHYPLDQCNTEINSVLTDLNGSFNGSGLNLARADGLVNQAVRFAGNANSRAELPATLLNGLGNFSLSLWFNTETTGGFREIISAANNTINNEFELYLTPENTIRAAMQGSYYSFAVNPPTIQPNTWYHLVFTRTGGNNCLYLNASLVGCATIGGGNLNVSRVALGVWWQTANSFADFFTGRMDEVLLYENRLAAAEISQIYTFQRDGFNYDGNRRPDICLSCLADDFSSASLGDSWVAARSSGTFTPQIVNGRLRMTQAVTNQATAATFQRLYPAANNLVIIEFDYLAYGGSGADGLAVVLSDANITPQAGSFGGPLGYGSRAGQNIPGFAGGWLGIGLDEFGNFSTEGGPGGPGRRQQSVVIRGSGQGTTGYRYLRGTCNNGATNPAGGCLVPRVDNNQNNPHRYRITVDSRSAGSAVVSVDRDHGTGYINLIAPFNALTESGQAAVPENFLLSLTGSTGGSTNIHELDNVSICALRSSPVGVQIDHFEFDYTGQALTCKPESFTIRACANPSCSELITSPVTATLNPNAGANGNWLGGNQISFSGGSTTAQLRRTNIGNVTVGVASSQPSTRPLSVTLCRAGSGALSAAACSVNFAQSGLLFDVPDGVANLPINAVQVSAVRQSSGSAECVPEFANVSRPVAFWSDYITPATSVANMSVAVNGSPVGRAVTTRTPLTLNFNAQGRATISVNYPDAGNVQLNARYTGDASRNDAGLEMNGADQFIRRPAGLCIQTGGECSAADATCPLFRRAAEDFNISISARAHQDSSTNICSNPLTPNFARAAIPLNHLLVTPSPGELGNLATSSYQHTANLNALTVVSQAVSEVGVFRFGSAAFLYQTMTDPVPAGQSNATGRFVPANFAVSDISLTAGCQNFSYQSQPFALGYTLTARNLNDQRTFNYHSGFAVASPVLQAANQPAGNDLSNRLDGLSSSNWLAGQWQVTHDAMLLSREISGADGPYSELLLALAVADPDAAVMADANARVPGALQCQSDNSCNAVSLATTDIRYGRLLLENSFGPEFDELPVRLQAQYWDGSRFAANPLDNCSPIAASRLQLTPATISPQATAATLSAGQSRHRDLYLPAPGTPGVVAAEYLVPIWLQYDWLNNGSFTDNPRAEFIFGRFRGNPRQIFWREVF